jgi:uridine monophosphate synthetase
MLYVRNQLIAELMDIGAVKYGDFTLKSGLKSPYYFDMRLLISYPSIYTKLIDYFLMKNPEFFREVKLMTGIHFGGVPLSNYISSVFQIPQIYIRDAAKDHGTQRQIEGEYESSNWKNRILVVDDVLTTGTSIREKYQILTNHGLDIENILVILDRREDTQGDNLAIQQTEYGTRMVSVFSIFTLADIKDYMDSKNKTGKLYYENRVANSLFEISIEKRTNIVIAADLPKMSQIIELVGRIHPYIAGVKIHADTLDDFSIEAAKKLEQMAIDHGFIIIEDRKLADIGVIGVRQLGGVYRIGEWADAVTVHTITGIDQIDAIYDEYSELGLIPVAELSCRGNLIDRNYVADSVAMCRGHPAICGFVAQDRIHSYISPFEAITFSPGIHLSAKKDDRGQQYRNSGRLGKYWIVGRGIYDNLPEKQVEMAEEYKRQGWDSFWFRVK